MRKLLPLLLILLLFVSACSNGEGDFADKETNIAANYLRKQGYQVIEHKHSRSYVLLERMLLSHPHLPIWSVQTEDVDKYLKKRVTYVTFEIKNHPLDNKELIMGEEIIRGQGKTTALVIVVGGKAVGGTALPVTDVPLGGLIFSLCGMSLEDIHAKSYAEWLEEWQTRFR